MNDEGEEQEFKVRKSTFMNNRKLIQVNNAFAFVIQALKCSIQGKCKAYIENYAIFINKIAFVKSVVLLGNNQAFIHCEYIRVYAFLAWSCYNKGCMRI